MTVVSAKIDTKLSPPRWPRDYSEDAQGRSQTIFRDKTQGSYLANRPVNLSGINDRTEPSSPPLSAAEDHCSVTVSLDPKDVPTAEPLHTLGLNDHNLYRDPKPIPHVSPPIFVYQHSETAIGETHRERFSQVVDIFRHNMDRDEALKDNMKLVDYGLRMCGRSQNDCHPSILVFCRQTEFKALKKFFDSKSLISQYRRQTSTSKSSRKFWLSNQVSTVEHPHKPLFDLYFWRGSRPRTLLWYDEATVALQLCSSMKLKDDPNHGLSLCGAPISEFQRHPRCSTLGCLIQVGSDLYGLTARHALRCTRPSASHEGGDPKPVAFVEEPDMELDVAEDFLEKHLEDEHFDDEIIYDDFTDDESNEDSDKTYSESSIVPMDYAEVLKTAIFPSPDGDRELDMDLDWALIALDTKEQCCPNAYVFDDIASTDSSLIPYFITSAASAFPEVETEVLVIVAQDHVKRGTLLPSLTILGGINIQSRSQVKQVVMNNGEGESAIEIYHQPKLMLQEDLTKGHSGSIIVDAKSAVVYGHVIASNPLGEIYIAPMRDTLMQIQHFFPTKEVKLPDPLRTLFGLIFRVMKTDFVQAIAYIKNVDYLVSEFPPLDYNEVSQLISQINDCISHYSGRKEDEERKELLRLRVEYLLSQLSKFVEGFSKPLPSQELAEQRTNIKYTVDDRNMDEAASMNKEVLEKRQQILGYEDPDTILAISNLATTLRARPMKKIRSDDITGHPLPLPRLLETLDAASLRTILQQICERQPEIGEEVIKSALRPNVRSAFQVLQGYQDKLLASFPYGETSSDYAYYRVKAPLMNLLDALTDFTPQYLPPNELPANISLEYLDGATKVIHGLPDWESQGYRHHKENAYDEISNAWALVINEAAKKGGDFVLHSGGWDQILAKHNQQSDGRLGNAMKAMAMNVGWVGGGPKSPGAPAQQQQQQQTSVLVTVASGLVR